MVGPLAGPQRDLSESVPGHLGGRAGAKALGLEWSQAQVLEGGARTAAWQWEGRAASPASRLGRSPEDAGPRERSCLPSPRAQPGLPAPSGGLRNLRQAGTVPGRVGEGLPGPPAPAAASPPQAASPDGAHLLTPPWAGLPFPPPVPALFGANLLERHCGQGPAWEAHSCSRGCPGCPGRGQKDLGVRGPHPLLDEPGKQS